MLGLAGALSFGALALGFAILLAYDIFAARGSETPAWYPRLRLPLTATVVSCLLLAAYRF